MTGWRERLFGKSEQEQLSRQEVLQQRSGQQPQPTKPDIFYPQVFSPPARPDQSSQGRRFRRAAVRRNRSSF